MIICNDYRVDYLRLKKIKIGHLSMNLKFEGFKIMLEDLYDIKVIDIKESTSSLEKKVKIDIWVESTSHIKNIGVSLSNESVLLDKPSSKLFLEYLEIENTQNLEVEGLFGRKLFRKPKRDEISILFKSFQSIAICAAECLILDISIQNLIKELNVPEIYGIPRSVVPKTIFVFKDSQIQLIRKSPKLKILARKYLELWKEHDHFGYLKEREKITFSVESKEKFENFYKSSWFRYTQ